MEKDIYQKLNFQLNILTIWDILSVIIEDLRFDSDKNFTAFLKTLR